MDNLDVVNKWKCVFSTVFNELTVSRAHMCIDSEWVSSVLHPRQYQHSIGYDGRWFLHVKRPNQQYQSTEGDATKDKSNNENNKTHIYTDNNRHKKGYTQNKHNKSPSLH